MRRTIIFVIAALACVLADMTAFARPLIVHWSGTPLTRFRPGAPVPRDLVLRAGERITLLGVKGTTEFKGPATLTDKVIAARTGLKLALDFSVGERLERKAVTRGFSQARGPAHPPGLWMIDAEKGGIYCLPADWTPILWRGRAANPDTLSVTDGDGRADVAFAMNQTEAQWPSAIAVTPLRNYRLAFGQRLVSVSFKRLAADWSAKGSAALRAMLTERECRAQAAMIED